MRPFADKPRRVRPGRRTNPVCRFLRPAPKRRVSSAREDVDILLVPAIRPGAPFPSSPIARAAAVPRRSLRDPHFLATRSRRMAPPAQYLYGQLTDSCRERAGSRPPSQPATITVHQGIRRLASVNPPHCPVHGPLGVFRASPIPLRAGGAQRRRDRHLRPLYRKATPLRQPRGGS